MLAYDVGVVLVAVTFSIIGYIRGFTWEAGLICGGALGLAAAFKLGNLFALLFLSKLPHTTASIIGFFAVFLMTFIVILGVTYLVRRTVERAKLEKADRWAGAVLGLLQGVAVSLLVTLALLKFGNEPLRNYINNTYSARASMFGAKILERVVPRSSKHVLPLHLPKRLRNP